MQQNVNLVLNLHVFTVCKIPMLGHISLSVTVYLFKMIMVEVNILVISSNCW